MAYKSVRERPWYNDMYKTQYANKEFVPPDNKEYAINVQLLQTAVIDWIIQVEDNGQFDVFLLLEFQVLCQEWTDVVFEAMDKRLRKTIKELFRHRGIFIPIKSRDSLSVQLEYLLTIEDCPEWPENELNLMMMYEGFKCRQTKTRTPTPGTPSTPTHFSYSPLLHSAHEPSPAQQNIKALTNLAKLYRESDKFTGEKYDVLNHKLVIFRELCAKVGILPDQYDRQRLAVSTMLSGKASQYYYNSIAPLGNSVTFDGVIQRLGDYFHTSENYQMFLNEWRTIMLKDVIAEHPEKTTAQCLDMVIEKLHMLYQAMSQHNGLNDQGLTNQLISACQGVEACSPVLIRPASTFEAVASELRNAVGNWARCHPRSQFNYRDGSGRHPQSDTEQRDEDTFYTNRRYNRADGPRRGERDYSDRTRDTRGYSRISRDATSTPRFRYATRYRAPRRQHDKKCYVCGKTGCWSTRHPREEREDSRRRFRTFVQTHDGVDDDYDAFLADFEGVDTLDNSATDEELNIFFNLDDQYEQFNTAVCGPVDGQTLTQELNNAATMHAITGKDPYEQGETTHLFTLDHRYGADRFQGIMPDTGAAGVSTAGETQVAALQLLRPTTVIDKSTAGQHRIRFGDNPECVSLGDVKVNTPFGDINFAVMPTNTPFLLCLADMDRHGIYLNNVANVLVHKSTSYPVVRKWGHPWLLLDDDNNQETAICHLTEEELTQLHRRFGHPAASRLYKILLRAGHGDDDDSKEILDKINKFCHQCQLTSKTPGRFKFTLRDK